MIALAPLPVLLLLSTSPLCPHGVRPGQDDELIDQAELERLTDGIRKEVEVVRKLTFEGPVSVAVTDREGFLAYSKRRLEKTTTPEELSSLETMAKLLGLIPAEMDYLQTMLDLLEEQVGGFYDPGENAFYLMSTFTGGLAKVILAHELTHALDDQHFDIDGVLERCKGNSDASFAFQAVVEGSGTSVMNRWTIENMGELTGDDLAQASTMGQEEMAKAPPYLWKPLLCVYLRGAAFLSRTDSVLKAQMSLPDMADVDRAFQKPPQSSEQVLHPEKYWDAEAYDPPIVIEAKGAELPDGWTTLHEDTLGEMGFALVFEDPRARKGMGGSMAVLGTRYTDRSSEGWGGDRYVLVGREDARVLVSYSVWDTAEDAIEALDAMTAITDHANVSTAACAKAAGLNSSGFLVRRGPDARSLVAIAASGADPKDLGPLVEALGFAAAGQPK